MLLFKASSDSLDLIMRTKLGRKWRKKTQILREDLNKETQTSLCEIPAPEVVFEETAIQTIIPISSSGQIKTKKRKRKFKSAFKATPETATVSTTTKISAVEKVRAAIEEKKEAEAVAAAAAVAPIARERRCSYKLDPRDSLIKHRRSYLPKIEDFVTETQELELKDVEVQKSRISISRDSLELARQSFHTKTAIKRVEESRLSLARDSLEVIRVCSYL